MLYVCKLKQLAKTQRCAHKKGKKTKGPSTVLPLQNLAMKQNAQMCNINITAAEIVQQN